MKVKALNCPNCGAAVADKSINCNHCRSRLKTMSCCSCYGTIFQGNKFCPLCGENAVSPNFFDEENLGDCPRCKIKLKLIIIDEIKLSECEKCEGIWTDIETFEIICANRENQSAVLKKFDEILHHPKPVKIQYVPCPTCHQLMNRNNFAKISGVIIDSCKEHGVWFDAEELPKIIEFIRKGGMEYSRQKEKAQLDAERERLRAEQFKSSIDRFKHESRSDIPNSKTSYAIREFIDFLIR
jgi:Zn-finger nucleic acid-binding protein